MSNITIRPAKKKVDLAHIAAFNCAMAQETEDKPLDYALVTEGVEGLFARPQYGSYVMAEMEGATVGCLMITYEWSDWRNGVIWWIQSVYIVPKARRKGVFRAMYAHVEEEARTMGDVCGLRLYVAHENRHAQATYEALGMTQTPYQIYESIF